MTPIEIIALIIAVVTAIKIVTILIQPGAWAKVVKTVYINQIATTIIGLILAVVVLKYLLVELTIVQIFAVMAFMALLMMIGFAAYGKGTVALANKMLKDRTVLKRSWLALIIWIVLIIWVLYILFFV